TIRGVDPSGRPVVSTVDHVISSAPLRELARSLSPALSPDVLCSADRLRYRDFLTVVVILEDRRRFDDNWIYIHSPEVRVGRIQKFKSWSPEMVPDPTRACYGMEYFCRQDDDLWGGSDRDLLDLAARE